MSAEKTPDEAADGLEDKSNECPVCKSSRYLNRNMRFLINSECYHKMCESCVDRLFGAGPRLCPIADCVRTLRRQKFRPQTFETIAIEREVDIRRRLAKIFNRCEDDFETLDDYNNYLNEVEDLSFNLINGVDVEETEKKLSMYENITRRGLLSQTQKSTNTDESNTLNTTEFSPIHKESLDTAFAYDDGDVVDGRSGVNSIGDPLDGANGPQHVSRARLKRTSARRNNTSNSSGSFKPYHREREKSSSSHISIDSSLPVVTFKGLKTASSKHNKPEQASQQDPFGGLRIDAHDYFVPHDHYYWDYLEPLRHENIYLAGGYQVRDFYLRALNDAFSGLGTILSDELTGKCSAMK